MKFFPIFFLLIFNLAYAKAEYEISSPNSINDTLDLGICYVGDSLIGELHFINRSSNNAFIAAGADSYLQTKTNNDMNIPGQEWFRMFSPIASIRPYTLLPNGTYIEKIKFEDNNNSNPNREIGRKEMKLRLAILNTLQAVSVDLATKEYFVIARITDKSIGAYEQNARQDILNFDSVYINPSIPKIKTLNLRNTSLNFIETNDLSLVRLSASTVEAEITLPNVTSFALPSRQNPTKINFEYFPKDLLPDTSKFVVRYTDLQNGNRPDSLIVNLYGVGVEQNLQTIEANKNYSYTNNECIVELGNTNLLVKDTVLLIMQNKGNINFGAKASTITNINGEVDIEVLKFPAANSNLQSELSDTLIFTYTPKQPGFFSSYIDILSDISDRTISSIPNSANRVRIEIRGTSDSPRLIIPRDTIDFGFVFERSNCDASGDTLIILENTGNRTLELLSFEAYPNNIFRFIPEKETLLPGERTIATIIFTPQNTIEYSGYVELITSEIGANNTRRINLKGEGLTPPQTTISLGKAQSMPGTSIAIPLYIDRQVSNLARRFIDTIYFDASLLKFKAINTIASAFESYSIVNSVIESLPGRLVLDIAMPSGRNFDNNPKLAELQFDTYLGNSLSTAINLTNPKFFDTRCEGVIIPNIIINGSFSLDSVCAPLLKAYNKNLDDLLIWNITPNPATEALQIYSSNKPKTLEIISSEGIVLHSCQFTSFLNLDLNLMTNGMYFAKVYNFDKVEVRSFVISK